MFFVFCKLLLCKLFGHSNAYRLIALKLLSKLDFSRALWLFKFCVWKDDKSPVIVSPKSSWKCAWTRLNKTWGWKKIVQQKAGWKQNSLMNKVTPQAQENLRHTNYAVLGINFFFMSLCLVKGYSKGQLKKSLNSGKGITLYEFRLRKCPPPPPRVMRKTNPKM